MRRLKVIAASWEKGINDWLVVTFENYPEELCINIQKGDWVLNTFFGRIKDSSEMLGKEVLLAELPKQKSDGYCWERIESPIAIKREATP